MQSARLYVVISADTLHLTGNVRQLVYAEVSAHSLPGMGVRSNGRTIPNFHSLGQSLKMLFGVFDVCGHDFPNNVFITQSLDERCPGIDQVTPCDTATSSSREWNLPRVVASWSWRLPHSRLYT